MIDLIFDTETTGFAWFYAPWEHPSQPYIVQIAARLVENGKVHAAFQAVVNGSTPSSEGALKTHGITQALRHRVGISPYETARIFWTLLNKADRLVAHNIRFDLILVGALFYRHDFETESLKKIPKFCTMLALTPVMKLPGARGGYKWPKLEEAYAKYVDASGMKGAHDAMVDVIACEKLFEHCKSIGLVATDDCRPLPPGWRSNNGVQS